MQIDCNKKKEHEAKLDVKKDLRGTENRPEPLIKPLLKPLPQRLFLRNEKVGKISYYDTHFVKRRENQAPFFYYY